MATLHAETAPSDAHLVYRPSIISMGVPRLVEKMFPPNPPQTIQALKERIRQEVENIPPSNASKCNE